MLQKHWASGIIRLSERSEVLSRGCFRGTLRDRLVSRQRRLSLSSSTRTVPYHTCTGSRNQRIWTLQAALESTYLVHNHSCFRWRNTPKSLSSPERRRALAVQLPSPSIRLGGRWSCRDGERMRSRRQSRPCRTTPGQRLWSLAEICQVRMTCEICLAVSRPPMVSLHWSPAPHSISGPC